MDARTGAEAITTRIGAKALPLGIILLVVATVIHPSAFGRCENASQPINETRRVFAFFPA